MMNREKFRENFSHYDRNVVVLVIDIFLEEHTETLNELQRCIHEQDFESLRFKAHNLKGTVAYMSSELAALSLELETLGREKKPDGLQQTYDLLKKGVLELVEEMKEVRQEYVD